MRIPVLLFFLALAPVIARGESPVRPEISVQSGPVLQVAAGMPVLLSDLASVSRAEAGVATDLEILPALGDKEERSFSNAEIVRLIREKIETDPRASRENWVYFAPEKIRIVAFRNHIPENRVTQRILAELGAKCSGCRFQLRDLKFPVIRESEAAAEMTFETSGVRLAGGFLVPIKARFAGGWKTFYVSGRAQAWSRALVASRSLQAGEPIEGSDVRVEEVEISFARDALATFEDLLGQTASRTIPMGQALHKSDLRKEVLVRRGQIVRVVSGSDVFEVSVQVQAEENGSFGDVIRLKNPETQKLLSGQVVEKGLVRIR